MKTIKHNPVSLLTTYYGKNQNNFKFNVALSTASVDNVLYPTQYSNEKNYHIAVNFFNFNSIGKFYKNRGKLSPFLNMSLATSLSNSHFVRVFNANSVEAQSEKMLINGTIAEFIETSSRSSRFASMNYTNSQSYVIHDISNSYFPMSESICSVMTLGTANTDTHFNSNNLFLVADNTVRQYFITGHQILDETLGLNLKSYYNTFDNECLSQDELYSKSSILGRSLDLFSNPDELAPISVPFINSNALCYNHFAIFNPIGWTRASGIHAGPIAALTATNNERLRFLPLTYNYETREARILGINYNLYFKNASKFTQNSYDLKFIQYKIDSLSTAPTTDMTITDSQLIQSKDEIANNMNYNIGFSKTLDNQETFFSLIKKEKVAALNIKRTHLVNKEFFKDLEFIQGLTFEMKISRLYSRLEIEFNKDVESPLISLKDGNLFIGNNQIKFYNSDDVEIFPLEDLSVESFIIKFIKTNQGFDIFINDYKSTLIINENDLITLYGNSSLIIGGVLTLDYVKLHDNVESISEIRNISSSGIISSSGCELVSMEAQNLEFNCKTLVNTQALLPVYLAPGMLSLYHATIGLNPDSWTNGWWNFTVSLLNQNKATVWSYRFHNRGKSAATIDMLQIPEFGLYYLRVQAYNSSPGTWVSDAYFRLNTSGTKDINKQFALNSTIAPINPNIGTLIKDSSSKIELNGNVITGIYHDSSRNIIFSQRFNIAGSIYEFKFNFKGGVEEISYLMKSITIPAFSISARAGHNLKFPIYLSPGTYTYSTGNFGTNSSYWTFSFKVWNSSNVEIYNNSWNTNGQSPRTWSMITVSTFGLYYIGWVAPQASMIPWATFTINNMDKTINFDKTYSVGSNMLPIVHNVGTIEYPYEIADSFINGIVESTKLTRGFTLKQSFSIGGKNYSYLFNFDSNISSANAIPEYSFNIPRHNYEMVDQQIVRIISDTPLISNQLLYSNGKYYYFKLSCKNETLDTVNVTNISQFLFIDRFEYTEFNSSIFDIDETFEKIYFTSFEDIIFEELNEFGVFVPVLLNQEYLIDEFKDKHIRLKSSSKLYNIFTNIEYNMSKISTRIVEDIETIIDEDGNESELITEREEEYVEIKTSSLVIKHNIIQDALIQGLNSKSKTFTYVDTDYVFNKYENKLVIKSNNFNLDSMNIKDYVVSNINELKLFSNDTDMHDINTLLYTYDDKKYCVIFNGTCDKHDVYLLEIKKYQDVSYIPDPDATQPEDYIPELDEEGNEIPWEAPLVPIYSDRIEFEFIDSLLNTVRKPLPANENDHSTYLFLYYDSDNLMKIKRLYLTDKIEVFDTNISNTFNQKLIPHAFKFEKYETMDQLLVNMYKVGDEFRLLVNTNFNDNYGRVNTEDRISYIYNLKKDIFVETEIIQIKNTSIIKDENDQDIEVEVLTNEFILTGIVENIFKEKLVNSTITLNIFDDSKSILVKDENDNFINYGKSDIVIHTDFEAKFELNVKINSDISQVKNHFDNAKFIFKIYKFLDAYTFTNNILREI